MRTIKFRAWDASQNRMFDVYALGMDFISENTLDGIDLDSNLFNGESFDKNIRVMQFTGLSDKNGKEIYEGDIIQFKYDDMWEEGGFGILKGVVVFDKGRFVVSELPVQREEPITLIEWLTDDECEVAGNVFEKAEPVCQ